MQPPAGAQGVAPSDPAAADDPVARLRRLLALTSLLAEATTGEAVTHLVVEVATGIFGGVSGSLCLLSDDGSELRLVADIGSATPIAERWATFPVGAPTPAGEAVATGRPVLLPDHAARDVRFPLFAGVAAADQAHAVLPLLDDDGRPFGVLTVGFPAPRGFDDDDVGFLEALAQQCALALLRARRLDEQRIERQRRDLVADAAAATATASSTVEVAERLVAVLAPRMADFCSIDLLEGERIRRISMDAAMPELLARWRVESRIAPLTLDEATPVAAVLRGEGPVHLPFIDPALIRAAAPSPEILAMLDELELRSAVIVPLGARGAVLGAMTLVNRASSRTLSTDDLAVALEIGQKAGIVLDNLRLLEREHRIAETLQLSLLPQSTPPVPGLRLARRYAASSQLTTVGGDWYDVFRRPDGTYALCVGDIAGHDIAAAAAMGQVRSALRAYALDEADPAIVFAHLDRAIREFAMTEMATAVLCTWEPGTRRLSYAHAGHPPLLHVSASGAVRRVLDGRGPVLGAGCGGPFTTGSVHLEAGDLVLLYTDGLVERRGSDIDVDLDRLCEAAGGLERFTVDGICEELLERMGAEGGWEDDVALLAARVETTSPASP